MDLFQSDNQKKHRAKTSGVKKDKKDKKKKNAAGNDKQKNHKAFSVSNIGRTKKLQQRNLDRAQKKEIIPLSNRANEVDEHPPVIVVVMGPKGSGKSTLIRSLVKMFTSQNLTDTKGPITCVAGLSRRITFFECPTDIHSMTDLGKVADLVLLLVDASYGFEMETFEFLNILQLHGFPKVMGVLTHLDSFTANKSLQNTKKALKHRFWTEIYKGAKMFDFTGVINGKYLKHEVKRLSLYISRVKFRPLVWRNNHPYVLVDRIENITLNEKLNNEEADLDVTFYGYVRGTHLKADMNVHLIGAGDFTIAGLSAIEDPCPCTRQQNENKKLSLKNKGSKLYAPLANVGRVHIYDKDSMYIDIKDIHYTKKENLHISDRDNATDIDDGKKDRIDKGTPVDLLRSMQDVEHGVDELMKKSELSLFKGSKAIKSSNVDSHEAYDNDDDDDDGENEDDSDDDEDDNDDEMDYEMDDEQYDDNDNDNDEDNDDDNNDDNDDNDDEDDEDDDNDAYGQELDDNYQDDDDDDDDDNDNDNDADENTNENTSKWKENMREKASVSYIKRSIDKLSLMETVYGANWAMSSSSKPSGSWNEDSDDGDDDNDDDNDDDDNDDDDFFTLKNSPSIRNEYKENNSLDSNRIGASSKSPFTTQFEHLNEKYKQCQQESNKKGTFKKLFIDLKEKFVTGGWGKKATSTTPDENDNENDDNDDDDDEAFGDFEDLQTGEKFTPSGKYKMDSDDDDNDDDDDDDDNDNDNNSNDDDDDDDGNDDEGSVNSDDVERMNQKIDDQLRQQNAKSKAEKKARFDLDYDEEQVGEVENEDEDEKKYLEMLKRRAEEQSDRNKKEFGEDGEQARLRYEGFRQGIYVRVVLSGVPKEFMQNFRPHLPCILGGLLPHESALGYVRARVKRHRWHKRILKSNDPLILSVGWRRFQTMPVYTMTDIDERQRFVKYTPEHMHCDCIYYGPLIPPNTGILAFQRSDSKSAGFRISMTGTSLELKSSPSALKKLKLTGTPVKVFKNTAFITGMFNSALEVAKFEGAKIKTVSGIRGQVKKPLRDGEPGKFRATFEDKILLSDIVICRLWVPVEIKKFYNPVLTFLTSEDPEAWQGMRTTSQIRRDEKVPIPVQKDSLYAPITRVDRKFKKLVVPTKLQAALPFASKPKQQSRDRGKNYVKRRAVVLDSEDRKKRALLSTVGAISNEKQKIRTAAKMKSLEKRDKSIAKVAEKFADVHREEKKRKFRNDAKDQSQKRNRN